MGQDKTQNMIFVSEVLPSLFHDSPKQFLTFLSKDGTQFLRFYWQEVGKRMGIVGQALLFGLNYDIRTPDKKTVIALVTLPAPPRVGEAYFAAGIYRPLRVTPILRVSDMTKVVVLELDITVDDRPRTLLVEWTKRLVRDVISTGPDPVLEAFYAAVLDLVRE